MAKTVDPDKPLKEQLPPKDYQKLERQSKAAGTTPEAYLYRLLEGERFT